MQPIVRQNPLPIMQQLSHNFQDPNVTVDQRFNMIYDGFKVLINYQMGVNNDLQNKNRDLTNRVSKVEVEKADLQDKVNELTDQVEEIEEAKNDLQDEIDELTNQVEKSELENKKLQDEIDEMKLKPLKEELINKRNFTTDLLFGGCLGTMVGAYGGCAISSVTGLPGLPLIVGGIASTTQFFHKKFTVQEQKEWFESYEKSYQDQNPAASKQEIFNYAKEKFEQTLEERKKIDEKSIDELTDAWL